MEDKDFATRALSDGIWGDEMNPTDTPRTEADAMNELRIKAERELSAARKEIAELLEYGRVTRQTLQAKVQEIAELRERVPIAWLIIHADESTELVMSPLTDETFIDDGEEAWPLYNNKALAAIRALAKG